MNKQLVLLLAGLAGITLTADEQAISEAEFSTKFNFADFNTKLEASKEKITSLKALTDQTAEIDKLKSENTNLQKFKTDNEPKLANLAIVDGEKATTLAEVLRISKVVNGKDVDASLKATYESADLKTLKAFLTPLQVQLDDKFPLECKKCHSKELSRGSAEIDGDGNQETKLTINQVRDQIKAKARASQNKNFLVDTSVVAEKK